MEDISRDLEKEIIARTRHIPVRRKIKSRFFLIDDLGGIKPASWIKGLAWFFALAAIVSTAAAFLFYSLYTQTRTERIQLAGNLAAAEKKISALTNEKEILMARIVISGKQLPHELTDDKAKVLQKNVPGVKTAITETKKTGAESGENLVVPELKKNKAGLKRSSDKKTGLIQQKIDLAEKALQYDAVNKDTHTELKYDKNTEYKKIGLENFKILNDKKTGELLVRFNIRNASERSGNISGRIFVILKPDANPLDWLAVPGVPIRDGKPANPKRGQYFSIAHFKPVNFRIKDNAAPGFFKKASVFIYDQDKLIYTREINISKNMENKE